MLSEGWLLSNKVAHLCLLFCSSNSEQSLGRRGKYVDYCDEMNGIKENTSFHSLGTELFFSSANGDARSILSDSLEAPLKATGSWFCSYCPSSWCIFFSIPRVPLLANTLIITSLGNVHTQELLVTDSTHFSISRQVTAEEGMFGFLCLEQNTKRQHGLQNLLFCFNSRSRF